MSVNRYLLYVYIQNVYIQDVCVHSNVCVSFKWCIHSKRVYIQSVCVFIEENCVSFKLDVFIFVIGDIAMYKLLCV